MNQIALTDEVGGPADKRDDVERVVPGFVATFSQLDDELLATGNGGHFRQRLEIQATDEVQQSPGDQPRLTGSIRRPCREGGTAT